MPFRSSRSTSLAILPTRLLMLLPPPPLPAAPTLLLDRIASISATLARTSSKTPVTKSRICKPASRTATSSKRCPVATCRSHSPLVNESIEAWQVSANPREVQIMSTHFSTVSPTLANPSALLFRTVRGEASWMPDRIDSNCWTSSSMFTDRACVCDRVVDRVRCSTSSSSSSSSPASASASPSSIAASSGTSLVKTSGMFRMASSTVSMVVTT
mmetsp:Transcript_26264/g.57535  ORF Transcript_26264/g.57535 Transcript_26264/m.57535 type:complete len:214 (-) Transcript_26264:1362-2003(-)